ncbi:MAG: hypothetical protein R3E84_10880 [Pseudomonadales bacterium]
MNPVIRNGRISGRLAPGMQGDAVITTVNPLENIAALANDDAVSTVIQRGVPLSP